MLGASPASSGQRSRTPLARTASHAVAGAGSRTSSSNAVPGRGLKATVTRSIGAPPSPSARAMDLLGTLDERIDERIRDAVEHRADRRLQDGIGEGIAH